MYKVLTEKKPVLVNAYAEAIKRAEKEEKLIIIHDSAMISFAGNCSKSE